MSDKLKNMRALFLILLGMISLSVSAQTVNLTGNVKDQTGEPIIGASILEKGTTNGTITDFDGNFNLNVSANATLTVSYIGMKSEEVALNGKTFLDVTLKDDTQALEEVVVIGYGTVKRKDLTGSVASVSADAIAAVPVASAMEAITGKLAGVQISSTEGSPDAEMTIRVRGGGSITGDNTPLFIVDGFPVESISDIPPGDIESIDVLKDASSTAIYGSRGANGVIIVTTKSGKEGKISINYNAYVGWKKMAKKLDVLDPYDYALYQYERAMLKDGKPDKYVQYFGNLQDVDMYKDMPSNDWQEQVFGRTGFTFNHNLSINGGSEKTTYAFSYNHINDKAIMQMSNYRRDNLSLKLKNKPNKAVTLDFSVRYSNTEINGSGANEQKEVSSADSRLKYAMIYPPIPVGNLTDSEETDSEFNLYHPLEAIADNDRNQRRKTYNMNGSVTWEIIKNLKFKSEIGLDDYRDADNRFYGKTTYYVRNIPSAENQDLPAVIFTRLERNTLRNTNTLNYDFKKIISQPHGLNLLVGQEYMILKEKVLTSTVHGFPETFTFSDAVKLSGQGTANSIENYIEPNDILFSFFARANYDYQSKYLLSATFRADGSSKFAEGNRWGFFPSAAAAWRISSEPFMEGTNNWLDDMKIRFSYGTAGNNKIPSGQMSQLYEVGTTQWINGTNSYWGPSKTMANPDLKWETTVTRNLGVDITVLNGRLNASVEAYLNNTKDLLIQFPIQGVGYDNQYRNLGKTENRGLEATVNWVAIEKKNFGLSVSANIGFNKNKVISLGSMDNFTAESGWSSDIGADFIIQEGKPVGQIYGYKSLGRYELSDFEGYDESTQSWILKQGQPDASGIVGEVRPGTMKLARLREYGEPGEDGWNTVTAADKTIIGDTNPLHTGGFSLNARVYGFDIAANFNWSYGNDIYNANKIEYTSSGKYHSRNLTSDMARGVRWTNLRTDGTISNNAEELAAMNTNTTLWNPYVKQFVTSDWAVEDGSFLRLNTLTIGYTLPRLTANKIRLQNCRFYVTGYNLFCWTKYSGFDPEVSTRRKTALTPGVDYSAYPKSRSFNVGVNLSF